MMCCDANDNPFLVEPLQWHALTCVSVLLDQYLQQSQGCMYCICNIFTNIAAESRTHLLRDISSC